MFTFTNDLCLQRTKKKKETGKKEKKGKEGKTRRDETSITEKETGNPSKRKRGREERKGEDK